MNQISQQTIIKQIVRQYVNKKYHEASCIFCKILKNMKGEK